MRTRSVSNGTAELAVDVWGEDGPPIVALHPGVGDKRIWQWCAPVWAEAGYRTVAYDRRGYGETKYREERHDDLDDLVAVTSATDTRPAAIVGNSLGGGLAVDLALAYPAQVSALVLIAPGLSGYPYDGWPLSDEEAVQDDLVQRASESGDLDLVNRLEVRYWLDGTDQPEGRVDGPSRELMLAMNGLALRAQPAGTSTPHREAWPIVEQVAVPTLVVVGEHDLPGIRQSCETLAERIPDAIFVTMEDTAHCPSLDQPEALSRLVLKFLASDPP